VQVLADAHGIAIHLFERECSIQRRHQKVIEETPSPGLSDAQRASVCAAGLAAARAAQYVNAGTVEFLLDPAGHFYFLEMNTRLQVEHPVTEAVTGLDLVRLQIEVAAGKPLPIRQDEVVGRGHALEARLYAEDPDLDDLPSPGRILLFAPPEGPGIRVDAGVATGCEVTVDYDPMLAKVVTWGRDRTESGAGERRAAHDANVAPSPGGRRRWRVGGSFRPAEREHERHETDRAREPPHRSQRPPRNGSMPRRWPCSSAMGS